MKKLFLVLVLVGLVCLSLPACDGGGGGGGGGGESAELDESGIPKDAVIASKFDDGVDALRPQQSMCFICGQGPLKAEYHADVDVNGEKRRVYFDKQECADKFEQNPDRYLQGATDYN